MSCEVLDIKKEYENLSSAAKKVWEEKSAALNEVVRELGLTNKQKEAIMQRCMATLVYQDLVKTNEYLSRTGELFSQRKINKNKLEMQRVSRVYKDHEQIVKSFEPEVSRELREKEQERKKNQNR